MSIFYKVASGQNDFSTATRVKGPVPSYPNPRDLSAVVYTETWWQLAADYTPLARNTAHPALAAYLTDEQGFTSVAGGILEWQRIYATIPDGVPDYDRLAISYPGIYLNRNPYTQTVTVKLDKTYFLTGAGGTYATPDLIPLDEEQRVVDSNGLNVSIFSGDVYLNNGGGLMYATVPSSSTYYGWAAAAAAPDVYNLVIDSTLTPYMGNIWCRITRMVKAK